MAIARSILSILGGYALSVLLVMGSGKLMGAVFPDDDPTGSKVPTSHLLLATALFIVASIICAWVCAKLAPSRVRAHVLAFFALGEIMGLVFTVLNWGKVPHWYSIAWVIVWIPAVWIGWKLAGRSPAEQ
jgi:hypothetical protein